MSRVRVLCSSGVLVLLWGDHLQHLGAKEWEQRRVLVHVSSGERGQKAWPYSSELRGADPPLPPPCWRGLKGQLQL